MKTVKGAGAAKLVKKAKCLDVFERGVQTCDDFTRGMSLLMGDLITGRVSAGVGNAICNAGGKMLNAIDLNQRYGKANGKGGKTLTLAQ